MPTLAVAGGEDAMSFSSSSSAKMPAVTASASTSPTRYGLFAGRGSSKSPVKKEEGDPVPVELYTMIGDNSPMLMLNRKVAKEAEDALSPSSRTKWQWKEFENPARKDRLSLSHWERVPSVEMEADHPEGNPYHFARFNTSTNVYSYSSEEYVSHLRDDTGDWSRQETDYLFKLCHEYDLRWYIIHDRWDYPTTLSNGEAQVETEQASRTTEVIADSQNDVASVAPAQNGSQDSSARAEDVAMQSSSVAVAAEEGNKADVPATANSVVGNVVSSGSTGPVTTPAESQNASVTSSKAEAPKEPRQRSVEDMKDRYYSVCRRLIRARPASDETAKAALLQSYLFEKDREVARKRHIQDVLLNLTPKQLAEEEFLYIESRRLEQTYNKTAREREELWRLLGGVGPQSTSNLALTASFLTPAAHANAANAAGLAGMNVSNSSKKRRRGELDMLEDPQGGNKTGAGAVQAAIPQFTPEQDAQFGITRLDTNASIAGAARSTTVYLRSTKPPQLRTNVAPKIQQVLLDQNINMRLAMPTRANMEKLESLVQTITALMECKKQVERSEGEVRILQTRRGAAMRINQADKARAAAEEEQKRKERGSTGLETPAATPQPESSSAMQIDK